MIDRPAWVEVNLAALAANTTALKNLIGSTSSLCAVVKADAYGHGALAVARRALATGASSLAVALVNEGTELRKAGFSVPILVLGPTPTELASVAVDYDLTTTVFSPEGGKALSDAARALGKKARIHLKIDTGMGRIGIKPGEAAGLASLLAELPGLDIEGAYSHFATADEKDLSFAREQLDRFLEAAHRIEARGIRLRVKHIANSAAAIALPEARLDMVRCGIAMYGLCPAAGMDLQGLELSPVMSLKARASYVKDIASGVSVSYGRRWFSRRPSRVATIPLGYADGYPRALTNRAWVGVQSGRAPVVGTVCMDQLMIDVSDHPDFRAGDEVVLFGAGGPSVDEIAELLGTINYEVVCMVSKRLPRSYGDGFRP